ncbi:MAG: peptidase MA family metallohydrolase [Chloroflexota bacterium]
MRRQSVLNGWVLLFILFPIATVSQPDSQISIDDIEFEFIPGTSLSIQASITNAEHISELGLVITSALGTQFIPVDLPNMDGIAEIQVRLFLDVSHYPLVPFSELHYWWQITDTTGAQSHTPERSYMLVDDRYAWRLIERNGLSIYWTKDNNELGSLVWQQVEDSNEYIGAALGPVSSDSTIVVYEAGNNIQQIIDSEVPDWQGVTYPDSGLIIVTTEENGVSSSWVLETITHELVHLAAARVAAGTNNTPMWIHEGLALGSMPNRALSAPPTLIDALHDRELIPIKNLCRAFPIDKKARSLAGEQSMSLVAYLQQTYGSDIVGRLIKAHENAANCGDGVSRILDISIDQLESNWQEWLLARASKTSASQNDAYITLWVALLCAPVLITVWITVGTRSQHGDEIK